MAQTHPKNFSFLRFSAFFMGSALNTPKDDAIVVDELNSVGKDNA